MPVADPRELMARFDRLPAAARTRAAIDAGEEEVYLVGGAVRDLALGGSPIDVDLVVVGDPRPLASRLAGEDAPVRVHGRFGTASVRGADGVRYDLAAARTETYPRPGALPEVAPGTIEQDLERRDFTVNALALGLHGAAAGRLLGARHAHEDLAAGRLRVLHAGSFRDDPTRLLRLARYAGRLSFAPEPLTADRARQAAGGGALETVSGGRLGAELVLLAGDPDPAAGFAVLRALGIDRAIAPGFGIADPAIVRCALAALPWPGPPPSPAHVVLAAALLGVPAAERRPLLDRLALDAHTRREILRAAAGAPGLARSLPTAGPPSRLLEALPVDEPATIALAAGLGAPPVRDAIARWLRDHAAVRLQIDGADLIAAGVPRGPAVSAGLRAALGARLDGEAPGRAEQLAVGVRAGRGAG